MVCDANQQASRELPFTNGGGPMCPRGRRRGVYFSPEFSPDSAHSKWAAEVAQAQQLVWEDSSISSTSSVDREAEAGAQVLRMMSVLSFNGAPVNN